MIASWSLRPGCRLDIPALQAHLREHLAPYKRPSRIETVAALPTNPNGKIVKRLLHAQAESLPM